MAFAVASGVESPSIGPEFTAVPSPLKQTPSPRPGVPAGGSTTSRIVRLYFWANSKSRSSCPGTAMMAPLP